MLFWYEGLYPVRWVDGLIEDPADHGPGAVLLSRDEGGALRWDSLGEPLVYALVDDDA